MSLPRLIPRKAAEYLAALKQLLPRGLAWTRSPDSTLHKTLGGQAAELERLDMSFQLLLQEVNPETATFGLDDWDRVLGLPDQCLPAGSTLQERRSAVLAKLRDQGLQHLAYWYENAATLGYEVVIEEHWPFVCGWHECGDPSNSTPEEIQASNIGFVADENIRYWLNVIVRGDRLILFRCGESECGELLMDWRSAAALECVMRRDIEAHWVLTFEYLEDDDYEIQSADQRYRSECLVCNGNTGCN